MVKGKSVRTKGKLQLGKYFQKLEVGDYVSVIKENSVVANFPNRIQGKTGIVEGKKGRSYVVRINGQRKNKKFLIQPIHLKKIKYSKENDKKR